MGVWVEERRREAYIVLGGLGIGNCDLFERVVDLAGFSGHLLDCDC